MKRTRIIAVLCVVLICMGTGSMLFAQGKTEKGEAQNVVTLRFSWWGSDPRHEATLKAIARYQELYPNVRIEGEYQGYSGYQQKLMTQIAGRTEPDLIQLDHAWNPDLSTQGDVFLDLAQQKNVDLTQYPASVLDEFCTINGKIISIPMGTNGFGAMINKNFFAKHDIPVDIVWTWEKMIEIGAKINKSNREDYLFAIESGTSTGGLGPFVLGAYIYNLTGKYWADDATYTIQTSRADLVKAFTILKELYTSGTAQPLGDASLFTGQMEQNPKWLNGQIGFTVDWSGTIGKYKSAVGAESFTVGMPPFVEGGNNRKIASKPSMELALSARTAHPDIATHFANWLFNDPEAVAIMGTQRSIPANQTAFTLLNEANAIDPDVALMCELTATAPASPVPSIQNNNEVADIIKDICEQVVYGRMTPSTAADVFLSSVQAKLTTLQARR